MIFRLILITFLGILTIACGKDEGIDTLAKTSEFSNETKVSITGYNGDAMEPFISKNGEYLFFNSDKDDHAKDIYYAKKTTNTSFEFMGKVEGANSSFVDGNPSMDAQNNFYFISTRDLDSGNKTIFYGTFADGKLSQLKKIEGSVTIPTPYWINMGVEITEDGNTMYTSNAKFRVGETVPLEGNIRFAKKIGNEFVIPDNESEILANINTSDAIEYAGEVSIDELELFYSQVKLSNPPVFKLYHSTRDHVTDAFSKAISITEPFKNNINAFVEAPTLSADGKRLYYHKLDKGVFSIFMISRN